MLKEPERLRREFERRLQHPPGKEFDATHLEKSITQLKRRMGRLIDAYENGWLDKSDFEPRIRRVKERLAREEQVLEQQQRELSSDELRLLVGQFTTFAEQMAGGLEQADFATKRQLLRLLIQRIEVDEDEVRIVYNHTLLPPAPLALLAGAFYKIVWSSVQPLRGSCEAQQSRPLTVQTADSLFPFGMLGKWHVMFRA